MANNYQQSSFSVEFNTPEEHLFLASMEERAEIAEECELDPLPALERAIGDFGWGWNSEWQNGHVLFFSEEGGNAEAIVIGLQEFLAKFRGPKETISFTWSFTGDKMRPDEFGGGGVVFTATEAKWIDAATELEKLAKELAR